MPPARRPADRRVDRPDSARIRSEIESAIPAAPSKTKRKLEMHALQALGERLSELSPDKLAQLELPEDLAIALGEYRRFTKWEAKRRQMQYIGRLMREIDPVPISAQLDAWGRTSRSAVAGFHAAETWRDRLLAEDSALAEVAARFPAADPASLGALVTRARAERAAGKPPASARLLFRELVRLLDSGRVSNNDGNDAAQHAMSERCRSSTTMSEAMPVQHRAALLSPCALLTLLVGCASAPSSTPTGPAPGQWQLVIEVDDMPGSAKVPPQTMTMCSTPEDKKQWQDMIGGKSAAGCAVKDYVASGPTISYRMVCAGGIEGATTIKVVDEDHYAGESRLAMNNGGQSAIIRSRVTATRLGPTCKK